MDTSIKQFFSSVLKELSQGEDVVLATIVAGSGSTPRGAGARMFLSTSGICEGTIGGGNVEYQSMLRAKELLKTRDSVFQGYNLGDPTSDIGMVCGGQVIVFFQYFDHESQENLKLCKAIIEQCENNEDAWLIMDISQDKLYGMGIYTKSKGLLGMDMGQMDIEPLLESKAIRVKQGNSLYYSEPLKKVGRVYIFGGGHVAQELVPVLSHLDFECVVIDDRECFANETVFPQAALTIVGDFNDIEKDISITENDYVIIMTRGHAFDYLLQRQILAKNPRYIGVMGSRKKVDYITNKLLEDGFALETIQSCHMPIGLEIAAETPAEIAISIAGELIFIRAEGDRKTR